MEALQSYNSDSEESIGDTEKSSDIHTLDLDFFNLKNSDKDEVLEPENKVRKVNDSRIIMNSGEALTIPGSDFWKPLNAEIRTNVSDCSTGNNTFSVKTVHNPLCYGKRHCKCVNSKHISSEKVFETYKANHQKTEHRNIEDVENNDKALSEIANRKMFETHGKIKPWIQRQRIVCKIPQRCEQTWQGHTGSVNKVKWCLPRYSHLLLSVSMDTTVKIWNVWSTIERCVRTLRQHSKGVQDCDWNNTGTQILTCSYDKNAIVADTETGTKEKYKYYTAFMIANMDIVCLLLYIIMPKSCTAGELKLILNHTVILEIKLPCKNLILLL